MMVSGCHRQQPSARTKDLNDIRPLSHPISTSNPAVQTLFNQGLTFIYAFNFPEAINSFQQAANLDPSSPMPYWGIAVALGPNYNSWTMPPERARSAFEAVTAARKLSDGAPENEKAYVRALDYVSEAAQGFGRSSSGCRSMQELAQNYPNDPDAATFYAACLMIVHPWKLWSVKGEPGENTLEIVRILEEVLRRYPNHVGANRFYIHAIEASPFPDRALANARTLQTLVPAAGHLVHMPAHIYFRTGDYPAAVKSCLAAARADMTHLHENTVKNSNYLAGYAEHNLYFLIAAANTDGEFRLALTSAEQLEESTHSEAFRVARLLVLLRFARWSDILQMKRPAEKYKAVTFFWRYARGCAFAATKRAMKASEELHEMDYVYGDLPIGRAFGMFFNDWQSLHELATETLTARMFEARGDFAASIQHWRSAVAVQDRLNFDDVPDWYYPVRESLGAILLRFSRPREAEEVFREDLHYNPRNPRSLFGLQRALRCQGKTAAAARIDESLRGTWNGAQNDLMIEKF
jgi:tetratricopeptide (TPR) repeat protein